MEFSRPNILIKDTRDEINAEEKRLILETFAFKSVHPQTIEIRTKEFSAVCPGTGLPDIADVTIIYIPNEKCVELKSLKYYFFSYRDSAIFQEPVTDLIFDHLWTALEPRYLKVTTAYNTRGGFDVLSTVEKGAPLHSRENSVNAI